MERLVAREYPELLPVWHQYAIWSVRAEASVFMILHHFGGVWAATDVRPVRALDALLAEEEAKGHTAVVGQDPISYVGPAPATQSRRVRWSQ